MLLPSTYSTCPEKIYSFFRITLTDANIFSYIFAQTIVIIHLTRIIVAIISRRLQQGTTGTQESSMTAESIEHPQLQHPHYHQHHFHHHHQQQQQQHHRHHNNNNNHHSDDKDDDDDDRLIQFPYSINYVTFWGRPLCCKLKRRPFVVVVVCPSVCHGCIVAKRCKIKLRLLLITNRKWHTPFQMTYKSLTLADLQNQ